MITLTGTGELIRLIIRRDRSRLVAWVAVLSILPVITAAAFLDLYPTEESRELVAGTIGSNPALVAFLGPLNGTSIGALTAWRIGTLGSALVGLMAVLTMIRHTRDEEESGRRELLRSLAIGRNAPLAAAVIVVVVVGVLIGAFVAVGLIATGEAAAGSLAFGLGFAGMAAVFAGVGAVAAQLTESAAAARGIGISVLGVAFLLRMAGDGGEASGLGWMSWLSPIGWFGKLRPFAGEVWWVVLLWPLLAVAALLLAQTLAAHRDLGAGAFPPRPGPESASRLLHRAGGLAWRLERGSLLGWTFGIAVLGAVYGSLANGVEDLLDDTPELADIFERLGGEAAITDAYFAASTAVIALVTSAYAVRATLRLQSEETTLRAEPVFAGDTARPAWVSSHVLFAVAGPALILAVAGIVAGTAHGAIAGDVAGEATRVLRSALVNLPAVWVLAGIATALYGLTPRLTSAAWGALVAFLFLGQLGQILQLPQWALDLSPFTHTPSLFTGDMAWTPLIVLTVIAAALIAAGLAGFSRRDLRLV